ncbi:hypothetical protein [Pseudomonas rubra]|uniref:Uncharacterized protein n=1 Tax=Pseudomonas rubra TaxID=2942627 RepID=A0ABT5P9F5_9PSED|nr:hypothetical protein [Pseudomonas rubra]MDD1014938.1 hypothetical protein [Pseudomonas rubra]MDD1157806.1 hypothetical protein [Pseudomonas rubra]
MNLSRKVMLVCAVIVMTSPLAGWAETKKDYECRYSKGTDSPADDAAYDIYQASSAEEAKAQAERDPANAKHKDQGITVTCHEVSEE